MNGAHKEAKLGPKEKNLSHTHSHTHARAHSERGEEAQRADEGGARGTRRIAAAAAAAAAGGGRDQWQRSFIKTPPPPTLLIRRPDIVATSISKWPSRSLRRRRERFVWPTWLPLVRADRPVRARTHPHTHTHTQSVANRKRKGKNKVYLPLKVFANPFLSDVVR